MDMTLPELEKTISWLLPDELVKFREWFFEFDAKRWDCQIEEDAIYGRLGMLAEKAICEHQSGDSTEP